jgi:hypothetical protein
MTTCSNVSGPNATQYPTDLNASCTTNVPPTSSLLPSPIAAGDDMMTSLAILTMKSKQDERVASDKERVVAEKNQEAAEAAKIEKMRDLANDTFTQGLVEGVLDGASAGASAASAVDEYSGAIAPKGSLDAQQFTRDGKLLDAGSKALTATSRFGSAMARTAQEEDRKDMAVADHDVERAKSAVDSASTASRRAEDDIRETINAIRQYIAAKTQLANASIMKG